MKKKVLFLAKYLPPFRGGTEKVTHDLCESLYNSGLDVTVAGVAQSGLISADYCQRAVVLKPFGTFFSQPLYWNSTALTKEVQEADYIVHNFPHPLMDFYVSQVESKAKHIVVFHSAIHKKHLARWASSQTERTLSKARSIVVSSPMHLKLPELQNHLEKCHVIPFGTSIPRGVASQEKNFLLSVGRLVRYKGYKYLIEAMKGVDCELRMVGSGPEYKKLRRQIERLQLGHKVKMLGEVTEQTLRRLYRECKLFVLPSITSQETFGMSQLEAMSYGKPVVVTNLDTGVNFVNREGVTGLIAQTRDADDLALQINRILIDGNLRRDLGQAGRRRVIEKFDLEKTGRAFADLFLSSFERSRKSQEANV